LQFCANFLVGPRLMFALINYTKIEKREKIQKNKTILQNNIGVANQ